MSEPVTYKKYANRRLYDTDQSRYVTLSEVTQRIQKGEQIQVVDAKTKEDVTAFILTQVLLEQARSKQMLLPVPLLHLIIQYGDNLLIDFFQNHLQKTINTYLTHKSMADDQFKKWLEMGLSFSATAGKNLAEMNPFQQVFDTFSKKNTTEDE